jgi:hypothetical protein
MAEDLNTFGGTPQLWEDLELDTPLIDLSRPNFAWSEEEAEQRDPLFNALDLIIMEGLDRPSYIEDPEEALLLNQKEALKESYNLHGTIGPNPAYDESGNLIIDEGYGPDLALTPLLSKTLLAKIPKAYRYLREKGLSAAWDELGMELLKQYPNMSAKAWSKANIALHKSREAIKKVKGVPEKLSKIDRASVGMALEKLSSKPFTPAKFKDWLTSRMPHEKTWDAIEWGKQQAILDIAGPEGFKRFMYLNPLRIENVAGKDVSTSAGYKALYRTFNTLMRSRIQSAIPAKMTKLDDFIRSNWGGYANPYSNVPLIALREGKHGPKWGMARGQSTGIHEAGHVGRLQPPRDYKELQIMAEQSGMKLNTREGAEGLKWLDDTFFGSNVRNPGNLNKWQEYYAKKLQPYLRGDYKMTPVGEYFTPGDKSKYYLMPSEVPERMAQIRNLRNIKNPTARERDMLQRMENRELEYMTEEGLDYAVNKLWMAAPFMTDEEIYEDLK